MSGKSPVWFPQWPDALRTLRLPPIHRQQYRLGIIQYLRFCKETRQPATVESARAFMEQTEAQRRLSASMLAKWKQAINWFFEEGQKPATNQVGPNRVRREAGTQTRKPFARGNSVWHLPER